MSPTTPNAPLIPPQGTPISDSSTGLFSNPWFLYLVAVTQRLQVLKDAVLGWSSLTHVGRITKVTAAGTIGEAWFTESQVAALVSSTQAGLSALTATLGPSQTGLLVDVTDYGHVLQWTGTAFQRGPGDNEHSDSFHMLASAPTDPGWHACDGSSVNYLKYDGTLGTRTLPNTAGSAAYALLGSSYVSSISAAVTPTISAPTFSASGTTGAPSAVQSETLTGASSVASSTHTHTFSVSGTTSTPTASLPGDPVPNFELILYYRR